MLRVTSKLPLGLVVVPTTTTGKGKGKPAAWNRREIDGKFTRSWDWDNPTYEGAAIVTGPQSLTVTLDIDKPDKALEILKSFLPLTGMASGHGVDANKVRNCLARGAVTFRLEEKDKLAVISKDFLKEYGFEIQYQGKSQKVIGTHASGEQYFFDGTPVSIPADLLAFLSEKTGKLNPIIANGILDKPHVEDLLQLEPPSLEAAIKEALPSWKFRRIVERISGSAKPARKLPGLWCVEAHAHSQICMAINPAVPTLESGMTSPKKRSLSSVRIRAVRVKWQSFLGNSTRISLRVKMKN